MADLLFIGLGLGLFALVALYLAACERLLSREGAGQQRGRGEGREEGDRG